MHRNVRQIDTETGELLPEGMLVYVSQRPRIKERWVMTFQDALLKLAADQTITHRQLRVLLYLIGRLDFENYIHVPQTQISKALNLQPSNVSAAIAALIEHGILLKGRPMGRIKPLRLAPHMAWRGRVTALHQERAKHLSLVKTDADARAELEKNGQQRLLDDSPAEPGNPLA